MSRYWSTRAAVWGGIVGICIGVLAGFHQYWANELETAKQRDADNGWGSGYGDRQVGETGWRSSREYEVTRYDGFTSRPPWQGNPVRGELAEIAVLYARMSDADAVVSTLDAIRDRMIRIGVVQSIATQAWNGRTRQVSENDIDFASSASSDRLTLLKRLLPYTVSIVSDDELKLNEVEETTDLHRQILQAISIIDAQLALANGFINLGAKDEAKVVLADASQLAVRLDNARLALNEREKEKESVVAMESEHSRDASAEIKYQTKPAERRVPNSETDANLPDDGQSNVLLRIVSKFAGLYGAFLFIIGGITLPFLNAVGRELLATPTENWLRNRRAAQDARNAQPAGGSETGTTVEAKPVEAAPPAIHKPHHSTARQKEIPPAASPQQ